MIELPAVLLILVVVISITMNFVQYGRNIIATRRLYEKTRQTLKEREATSEILRISGVAVRSAGDQSDEVAFLTYFVEYVTRALQGAGAAVFTASHHDDTFQGCAVGRHIPAGARRDPAVGAETAVQQQAPHGVPPKRHRHLLRVDDPRGR